MKSVVYIFKVVSGRFVIVIFVLRFSIIKSMFSTVGRVSVRAELVWVGTTSTYFYRKAAMLSSALKGR